MNRRQLGASLGLTPTPYDSGNSQIEQGISKAGNKRLRSLLVELGWSWLRYQPDSALSQWYGRRFAAAGKRMRRVGIVALARRLAIALWRYLQHGEQSVLPQALEPLGVLSSQVSLCPYQSEEKPAHLPWRSRPKIASKSSFPSIAQLWRRVAKTMVRLVCARTTTRTLCSCLWSDGHNIEAVCHAPEAQPFP
jgi:hypothetical protein